jgi:hypothetical protein
MPPIYPIYREDKLSVEIITEGWLREIEPPRSREELQDFLEATFWRGELKADSFTRLALLKSMFRSASAGDWAGLVFVTQEDAILPEGIELADGGLLFDVNDLERPRIPVPSNDPESWTDASCASTYRRLSETPSRKHYPERTVGFLMMAVSRDQFVSLLSKHGLDLPKFWRAAVDEPQVEEELHSPKGGEAYRKGAPPAGSGARKRGRKPISFKKVTEAMRLDIQEGKQTPESLRDMLEKNLVEIYGFSRDTVRKARAEVLSEIVEKSNPDK